MVERELSIFIVLANIVLLIFIGGIVFFIIQYRKRKLIYESEKKMLNEQHTQELLSTQLESQQQTMQDIGREIHDNVGQKITLASIYLKQISHRNKAPELADKFEEINKILNESLHDLRQLSQSLVQPHFAQHNLVELLQSEALKVNQLGICRVSIDSQPTDIQLNVITKNTLFRLSQEFIQNSLKHAKCKHIQIKLHEEEDILMIELIDDGIGFDTEKQSAGIGLSNMQRRAESLGAKYSFHSEIGKGTSVKIILSTKN